MVLIGDLTVQKQKSNARPQNLIL